MKPSCAVFSTDKELSSIFASSRFNVHFAENLSELENYLGKKNGGPDFVFIDNAHPDAEKARDLRPLSPETAGETVIFDLPSFATNRRVHLETFLLATFEAGLRAQQNEIQNLFLEINSTLAECPTSEDLQKTLATTLGHIGNFFHSKRLSLILSHGERYEVVVAIEKTKNAGSYRQIDELAGTASATGQTVSSIAVNDRKIVFGNDEKPTNTGYSDSVFITAPMVYRNQIIGVLCMTSFGRGVSDEVLFCHKVEFITLQMAQTIALMHIEQKLSTSNNRLMERQRLQEFHSSTVKHDLINFLDGHIRLLAEMSLKELAETEEKIAREGELLASKLGFVDKFIREHPEALAMLEGEAFDLVRGLGSGSAIDSDHVDYQKLVNSVHKGLGSNLRRLTEMLSHVQAIIGELNSLGNLETRPVTVDNAINEYRSLNEKVIDAQAESKRLTVLWRVGSNGTVMFDPKHFARVLHNCVSNSLRYAEPGGEITVSSRRVPGGVEVCISNSFSGLSAEELEKIFEPGYRTESARDGGIKGSGIGLSYVRNIVRHFGGSAHAESPGRDGLGISVAIYLPDAARKARALVLGKKEHLGAVTDKITALTSSAKGFLEVSYADDFSPAEAEKLKNFGVLIYLGDIGNEKDIVAIAAENKLIAVCVDKDGNGACVVSGSKTHRIPADEYQISFIPELILMELNNLK